jgi:LPS export ABC transporter protein LptC
MKRILQAAGLLLCSSLAPANTLGAESPFQRFELTPMTYVATQAGRNEVVLQATYARYEPETNEIALRDFTAVMSDAEGDETFELSATKGRIDLDTSAFVAEGTVRGETEDGRRLETERMVYEQSTGQVSTNSPVLIREGSVAYRGGKGFVYEVRKGRFRLLGGASVEQQK